MEMSQREVALLPPEARARRERLLRWLEQERLRAQRLALCFTMLLCWGGFGVGWGGTVSVSCTCTHGPCYANAGFGVGWGGMFTFLAGAHMAAFLACLWADAL